MVSLAQSNFKLLPATETAHKMNGNNECNEMNEWGRNQNEWGRNYFFECKMNGDATGMNGNATIFCFHLSIQRKIIASPLAFPLALAVPVTV